MSFSLLPFLLIIAGNVLNVRSARIDPVISYQASAGAGAVVSYTFPSAVAEIVAEESYLFPNEAEVGYVGATPTGDEPLAAATAGAAPLFVDYYPLVVPPVTGPQHPNFDLFQTWGNYAPAESISTPFIPGSSALIPEGCQLEQVHKLIRHGSRYPSVGTPPAAFAEKLQSLVQNDTGFTATGALEFLNNWQFRLGAELLTPYGRKQEYNLGVKDAILYGQLLEGDKPIVARTTSEDRMVESMELYLEGLLGRGASTLSETVIIIEQDGYNNTLAPYGTCNNSNNDIGYTGSTNVTNWKNLYLKDAQERLSQLVDFELEISDLFAMQEVCAFETVALGFSSFCEVFTEAEFEGFAYAIV